MNGLLLVAVLQQFLPAGPLVAGGLADPREPRNAIGVISSTLFADELKARPGQAVPNGTIESDTHGVVQLGTNFPLVRFGQVTLSLQGGLSSRFRLESSDNDALSSDYVIALPLNYERGAWAGRIRLMHRSAHLGDELVQNTSIRRLEYDHEEVDALVTRKLGRLRVYGGGTVTLASSFAKDDAGIQAGGDGRWPLTRQLSVAAGADWQRHTIWEGNSQLSAAVGLEVRGPAGYATVQARLLNGASPLGEFFLDRERYYGIVLIFGR